MSAAVPRQAFQRRGQPAGVGPANLGVALSGRKLSGHSLERDGIPAGRENAGQQTRFSDQVRPDLRGAGIEHRGVEVYYVAGATFGVILARMSHWDPLTPWGVRGSVACDA